MARRKDDRLFNPNGRKHFRRKYSLKEVRYSLMVLIILGIIGGWISWQGANPDPELLALETNLLDEGTAEAPERARKLVTGTTPAIATTAERAERGPVPEGLAASGWRERGISVFERDNLYEKINGRAGYYESFGVVRLHFITLLHDEDEALAVDIEMYDHGDVANALGAYAGERQPGAAPELEGGTLGHMSRNAMFLVRGRFYVRAIGADESDTVKAQLAHLREVLAQGLEGEAMPWAYSLFVAANADPGKIGFLPENAFSFGFASNVYTVELDDDGAVLFAVASVDEAGAKALASQFRDGFMSYGKDAGAGNGVEWVEDQYLNTIAGVTTQGALVVGVRGAADKAQAEAALAGLVTASDDLPEQVLAQAMAQAASAPASADSGYGADEGAEAGVDGEDYGGGAEGENYGGADGEDYGAGGADGEAYGAGADDYAGEPGGQAPSEEEYR